LNQLIRKTVSLIITVVFMAGCAGRAVNPMQEARWELQEIEQAQKALTIGQTDDAEKNFMQALERGTRNAAEAAYQLGQLAHEYMNYEGADHYYRQAANLQPDNVLYLDAAGFIARETGQYADAEALCQRALALREKVLGPDHLDVAQSLNNLALLYYAQGQYDKAEALYQRKLAILEKTHGPRHPDVVRSLKNFEALQARKASTPSILRACVGTPCGDRY
jgi:tetratricopeptide (TPR) repeat protein